MNLKDINDLSDKLDEEYAWRRHELTNLKLNVQTSEGNAKETNLRAGIALLYAHWEGFVKNATTYYLQHISEQKLPYSDLKKNFLALRIEYDLINISEAKKNSVHTKIVNDIISKNTEISDIPYKNKIKTNSNLDSKTFKEVMHTVGLDYSSYELAFNLIDEQLLDMRNRIAHGQVLKAIALDETIFVTLHRKMVNMLEMLKEQIMEQAKEKGYFENKREQVLSEQQNLLTIKNITTNLPSY